MKIMCVGRSYPEKATNMSGIFEYEQAKSLYSFGNDITYIFSDMSSIKKLRKIGRKEENIEGVEIYGSYLPIGGVPKAIKNKIKTIIMIKLIKKAISKQGLPEIFYIHYPLLTLTEEIWEFLINYKIPIVVMEHWSKIQLREITNTELEFLKIVVEKSNRFIAVGENLAESIRCLTKTKKGITVLPNMVSPMFYYKNNGIKQDDSNFYFIAIGRLIKSKNFDKLIDAYNLAFKYTDNVYLNIVGDGPLYKSLDRKIKKMGLRNKIKLIGSLSRENTATLIRKSDVYISASNIETFGVPIIESLASGKPVVILSTGSIDKFINCSNGILVESEDVDVLSKALKEIYEKNVLYDSELIAHNALSIFGEKVIISKLNKIFNNINVCI